MSGPGRSLALLPRQAQVCTRALPKWEPALKNRNSSPSPAAEQLGCFYPGSSLGGFVLRVVTGAQLQAAQSPHSNAKKFCFCPVSALIPRAHFTFHMPCHSWTPAPISCGLCSRQSVVRSHTQHKSISICSFSTSEFEAVFQLFSQALSSLGWEQVWGSQSPGQSVPGCTESLSHTAVGPTKG